MTTRLPELLAPAGSLEALAAALAAGADAADDPSVCRIPLLRDGLPVTQTLCAFWKKGRPNPYAEVFANILKAQFH